MFPFERVYAQHGLRMGLLRGNLRVVKSCFLSLRKQQSWLDWNLPIMATESLSFIPEVESQWDMLSTIAHGKKSKAAYSLAKLALGGSQLPIVLDFERYILKSKRGGALFNHITDKPVSRYITTLAYAVEYLYPLIRFQFSESVNINNVLGETSLPWWAYPVSTYDGRMIRTSSLRLSYASGLSELEFIKVYNFIVEEGIPIHNQIDYENLFAAYQLDTLGVATPTETYFEAIDTIARGVVNTIDQHRADGVIDRDRFRMVGEE